MTPGAYLRLCRQAAGLPLDAVAGKFATEPRYALHVRAEMLAAIEADVAPASFMTIVVLAAIYPIDLDLLVALSVGAAPATARAAEREPLIVTVIE